MSTTTVTGVTRIKRKEARALTSAEFEKFASLAASLTPQEWATDTDCVGWDVHKMALHVLGSADSQASPLVFIHQLRKGLPLNRRSTPTTGSTDSTNCRSGSGAGSRPPRWSSS